MKKTLKAAAYIFFFITILGSITDCRGKSQYAFDSETIKSYRDIPGITEREISAIESLKSTRQSFSYGLLLSEDAYKLSGDRHPGFTVLLCDKLSDLFGIPFVPQMYNWYELKTRLDSYDIDFTNLINTTTDVKSQYFKTSPIIGTRLSVFTKEGEIDVYSEYDLRGKKVGSFAGSYSEKIFRNNFPRVNFTSVEINSSKEMADKLLSGEIDAFIYDAPDVFTFYEYKHVAKVNAFPYIHVPVSISTANPELESVISVITKYLMAGGIEEVTKLNAIGERDYSSFVLKQSLSEEEQAYIDNLKANGEKIPVGFTATRYPVAFYDKKSKEYQGIAKDVLDEVSTLTGIEFEIAHDIYTGWVKLETMLKNGEIKLLSQLIPNDARREYAIWPDTHYFSARYALLSNLSFPYLNMNQVPYVSVGLTSGTAEEAIYKLWFPDAEYIKFNTSDEGLTALETGEIDLFFCLDYTLLYESNFRENAGQKVNILFNNPVEGVPFGLNIDEVILCSIISKAQRIINTERIVRSWTSRVFDLSSQMAKDRVRYLTIAVICLLSLLVVMFLSVLISFSLRKAAAESRKNLQVLLDMLPVGVRILSLDDFTLLYSNKACLKVFGCSSFEEQVEGRSGLGFMPEYQPDGRKTIDLMNELFMTDSTIAEFQCFKLNGDIFTCRMISCTINYTDRNGHSHRSSLAVMEDVTAEEEKIRMLKNTAIKEQEANQLKTRFLAKMSHEIRTPMNAIIGMTELALRENNIDAKNEHIFTAKNASSNLLTIINDILDFSKIESGKLEIISAEYSVSSLLNDVINIIRMRLINSQVQFAVSIDSNIPAMLIGDETRIRQILINLLGNAVKYTEKGFISLSLYSKQIDSETVELKIVIDDSGIGIKEEDRKDLFKDFAQFDLEKNKGKEGVGLGLAITNSLVKEMNGTINVQSEYGVGSTFTVVLPQKFNSSEVLAVVESPGQKDTLIYDNSKENINSLIFTIDNLKINYCLVSCDDDLSEKLLSKEYKFLFINYELYKKNKEVIKKFKNDIEIVILSKFDQTIRERETNILVMPVYCNSVAKIFNGTAEKFSYNKSGEKIISFIAPKAKILIVDDMHINLKVAEGLLQPYKMQIDLCNDGKEAIELIKSRHYDLVFMDHRMPGMDGVETTKKIREIGENEKYLMDLPIVALTAHAVTGTKQMYLENGFNDYLSKPIDTLEMNVILEKWIPKEKRIIK